MVNKVEGKKWNDGILTAPEVAKRYGLRDSRSVHYAIRAGYIKAQKFGWTWIIKEKNLPEVWPITEYKKHSDHQGIAKDIEY